MSNDSEFDINKILAEAVVASSKEAYVSLKNKFLVSWKKNSFKKEYGFPLQTYLKIAELIEKVGKETDFKKLKGCIGKNHWAISFIKVGITLSDLSDVGERKKIDEIRNDIKINKGWKALNITTMGSTGAIRGVISYLDHLKDGGYSSQSIIMEFEKIIDEWEEITIFVHKENTKEYVKDNVKEKIVRKLLLFFIFSYGANASQIAMESLAELTKEKEIIEKNYLLDTYPHFDGVGTQVYMWSLNLSN